MSEATLQETDRIETLIIDFIRTELAGDEALDIDPEENLLTSGLVDSVGIVRLIAHLREQLSVEIPPTDLVPANFRTIQVMAAYMQRRQEG